MKALGALLHRTTGMVASLLQSSTLPADAMSFHFREDIGIDVPGLTPGVTDTALVGDHHQVGPRDRELMRERSLLALQSPKSSTFPNLYAMSKTNKAATAHVRWEPWTLPPSYLSCILTPHMSIPRRSNKLDYIVLPLVAHVFQIDHHERT